MKLKLVIIVIAIHLSSLALFLSVRCLVVMTIHLSALALFPSVRCWVVDDCRCRLLKEKQQKQVLKFVWLSAHG